MNAQLEGMVPLLRPLRPDDLDAVMAIENSVYPFPWTRGIFTDCLRVGYGCYAIQCDAELTGYVIYHWGAGESHLLNLCVNPQWQRRGLGVLLLQQAIGHVARLGSAAMFLEVRPSNPGAIAMYKKYGFREAGRRPDYYRSQDGREDAIVMRLELAATPALR